MLTFFPLSIIFSPSRNFFPSSVKCQDYASKSQDYADNRIETCFWIARDLFRSCSKQVREFLSGDPFKEFRHGNHINTRYTQRQAKYSNWCFINLQNAHGESLKRGLVVNFKKNLANWASCAKGTGFSPLWLYHLILCCQSR